MPDPTASAATLSPADFVSRLAGRELSERSAAQSHFIDLCRMLGVPAPTDHRETDSSYGFEAKTEMSASGVKTEEDVDGNLFYRVETGTGSGFADVWMRDHFAWEYKRANKYKNLKDALVQLRLYAPSLGNPPLLVVCDIDRFEIHTNFTGYPSGKIAFHISDLANPSDEWKAAHPNIGPVQVLRKLWDDPTWFRPKNTRAAVTAHLANEIGELAKSLRDAGEDPHAVAHFLMQAVFCFFAEDIGLLPKAIFTELIAKSVTDSAHFPAKARALFSSMEKGGVFGSDTIRWFNGGLYRDVDADPEIHIASGWLGKLLMVARADWNAVDPTILGTLFERSLDPDKRSQIGAHYTSRDDIMLIVEPVILTPLRRRWAKVQKDVAKWMTERASADTPPAKKTSLRKKAESAIRDYQAELADVRVLDPACGSGNFLFVTIRELLALEQEVLAFAARPEIDLKLFQRVQPTNLRGIDVNDYACELARVSIWIGYLQWLYANTGETDRKPVLDPLDTIEHRDAILAWADEQGNSIPTYREGAVCTGTAEWPEADFIVGNPPFLGSKVFRKWGLPDAYVQTMYDRFDLPNTSDLCCYWFEVARRFIKDHPDTRAGLLATQGIRGRENRTVLERIKRDGDIFMAWSDRDWVLDGAAVHVSIVGFDRGQEYEKLLDGFKVQSISAHLRSDVDVTSALVFPDNERLAFMGSTKGGPFEITRGEAHSLLTAPNPHGRTNLDVLRPWINGSDVTKRCRGLWIVDFGDSAAQQEASLYEKPFELIDSRVRANRTGIRDAGPAARWWLHNRPRPDLREAVAGLPRFMVTCRVSKHRLFQWHAGRTLPDSATFAFARSDDYFFGVLHSSVHESWARSMGTQLREVESGFRYTPTTCFETFPLPWSPGSEPQDDPHYKAIAVTAKKLDELRENWLNPPQWIKPIEDAVDRFEDFSDVPEQARPLLRQSAIMARAAKDKNLKQRTLTNLYNQRPSWLKLAHKALDQAVLAAYAAVDPTGDWDPVWADAYEPFGAGEITIATTGRKPDDAATVAAKQAAIAKRKEVDQLILANLLRLNQERAGG